MTRHASIPRGTRSAEFAFVCACAAPRAVARGVAETLDGDRIAAIAHRHQIVPLVVAALRQSGAPIPAALAARYDAIAMLRSAGEALQLQARLAAAGIDAIFLKGSALAMLAFGALDRRQFADIDLLVRPDDAGRAATLLADAGYALPGTAPDALAERVEGLLPLAKDIALRNRRNGQIVELHWRMTDNPRERPVWDREPIQWVELAPGAALPTLGSEALFAYLCGHGAAHMWARLRWLADVAALLAQAPDGGDRLWQGAVARGQGRAAASAILLSHRLLGVAPPPAFIRPRSLRLALLVAGARRVIEAGDGTTELARTRWRGWAEMAGKLLLASSAGDLAGWTMRLLFSVSDSDRIGGSRLWYVLHPLQRVPKLLARRRRRRALSAPHR